MNIVLIGYRGAGKSAVGRRLADRIGLNFFDTDELVERRSGQSIEEMTAAKGWTFFRQCEQAVIREVAEIDAAVIATGGGAVLNPGNVRALKRNGRLIWLVADRETIVARMQADPDTARRRPSLTGEAPADETAALLAVRTPLYRAAADGSVETSGKSLERVVDEICSQLGQG
jgi:shikimate kinase